jgi:hypothetical protein
MSKAFPQIIYESYELLSTSKKSSIANIAGFIRQTTKIKITHVVKLPILLLSVYIILFYNF